MSGDTEMVLASAVAALAQAVKRLEEEHKLLRAELHLWLDEDAKHHAA